MEKRSIVISLVNTETMQANNIMNADMLDILFEHKNKAYGAYDLRRTYDKRLYAAMGVTIAVGCLFTMTTLFAGSGKKVKPIMETITIELKPVEETKKKEEPAPQLHTSPPPAAAARVIEQVRVQQHVVPNIVPDDVMPPDQKVATVEQLEKAQIGTISSLGGIDDPGMAPVPTGPGTGNGLGNHMGKGSGTEVIDEKVVIVQVEARYPGGLEAWKKFLERNLNRDMPVENGAPMARYTVVVSFTVDKDGNVSDIKAENDPGYGTAAEAVRVIKKSNKWQPAIQNGRNVTYRQRQSITFEVSEN